MLKLLEIIRSFLPNFEGLSNISSVTSFGPGWLFGALGTLVVPLFGLSIGRTRAVMSLLSVYVAFAFYILFPYTKELNNIIGTSFEYHWLRLGVFLGAYVIIFFILNFSFIKKRISSQEYSLFGIILLSLLQLGLMASIILNILPSNIGLRIPLLYSYIAGPVALFFWAIAPLPVLLFIRK